MKGEIVIKPLMRQVITFFMVNFLFVSSLVERHDTENRIIIEPM